MDDDGAIEHPVGRDTGLAHERTELAWNRSGLAVAVTIAIVLRRMWPLHGGTEVLGLALIAGGAATWVMGMQLGHRVGSAAVSNSTLGESACRMLTIGTFTLAIAGLVVSLL
jgi:uncharacterized membrane protein YidH (DUF202 family)